MFKRMIIPVISAVFQIHVVVSNGQNPPEHVWPLGNSTLFNDVINLQHIQHDVNNVCYKFVQGPPGLPYTVFDFTSLVTPGLDVILKGASPLRDLSVGFYVYPMNDPADVTGTLLHYQLEDREFIRVRMLANTFLVSFRDEYGMSAGMMYLVDFLNPHTWNHVTISRVYSTGRIIVYKDGTELYNMDDDFSNVISFPHDGKLRVGMSQDPDDADVFDGHFACVQVHASIVSSDIQDSVMKYCRPQNWNNHFSYFYETTNGYKCLADPPEIDYSMVSMTTLTRGSNWYGFLDANGLQESTNEDGYLKILSRDQEPSTTTNLIGSFNVTSTKVCVRLCVRVDGCVFTWVNEPGLICSLYNANPVSFVNNIGSKLYMLVV